MRNRNCPCSQTRHSQGNVSETPVLSCVLSPSPSGSCVYLSFSNLTILSQSLGVIFSGFFQFLDTIKTGREVLVFLVRLSRGSAEIECDVNRKTGSACSVKNSSTLKMLVTCNAITTKCYWYTTTFVHHALCSLCRVSMYCSQQREATEFTVWRIKLYYGSQKKVRVSCLYLWRVV